MGSDGPSDEEASGSVSSPTPYNQTPPYPHPSRNYSDDVGGQEFQLDDDNMALPPPPPPLTRPPTSTKNNNYAAPHHPEPEHPSRQHRTRSSRRRHDDRGRKHPTPRYPTTIEIAAPRSRIANRAKQKISHAPPPSPHNYEETEPSTGRGNIDGNYESFPDPLDHSYDDSLQSKQKSLRRRRDLSTSMGLPPMMSSPRSRSKWDNKLPPPSPSSSSLPKVAGKNNPRGKVLVHYHPQLGDDGIESTLLDEDSPDRLAANSAAAVVEDKYPRVGRAMIAATRRERGAIMANPGPPKQTRTLTSRGMHTRMIDDVREEELNQSSLTKARGPQFEQLEEGNDEYNHNAPPRQIRRRVFRVSMERGMHDERRRKLLNAETGIGGSGLRMSQDDTIPDRKAHVVVNGGIMSPISPLSPFTPGVQEGDVVPVSNGYQSLSARKSSSGGSTRSLDEGDKPLSLREPSYTPKVPVATIHSSVNDKNYDDKYDDSHLANDTNRTLNEEHFSPPSPPNQPPTYETIVRNLIAANEPEKLTQIDRVMQKYAGREEELIKKLDLRYRRKKAKEGSKEAGRSRGRDRDRTEPPVKRITVETEQRTPRQSMLPEERAMDSSKPIDSKTIEKLTSPGKITFLKPHQPNLEEIHPSKPLDSKTIDRLTSPEKITFLKVEPITTPGGTAITTPNKNKNAIMAMQSRDRSDDREDGGRDGSVDGNKGGKEQDETLVIPPPKIMKKALPAMISESTKTDLHSNNAPGASMDSEDDDSNMIPTKKDMHLNNALMSSMDSEDIKSGTIPNVSKASTEDVHHSSKTDVHTNAFMRMNSEDDNSGMIPLGNGQTLDDGDDNNSGMIPNVFRVNSDVENLGNQVMKERISRGKQREHLIVRAASGTSSPTRLKEESKEIAWAMSSQDDGSEPAAATPKSKGLDVTVSESPDYKLKHTQSYGDGISVITMETKSTFERKRMGGGQHAGDEEPVYSFDEMLKRPPNSITLEDNSGSFENNISQERKQARKEAAEINKPPKIQRIVPEVETDEDKAKAAETTAKLNEVEERIRARQNVREERMREDVKSREDEAKRKAEYKTRSDALMAADDELDSMEAMFRAHKSKGKEGEAKGEASAKAVTEFAVQSNAMMEADDDIIQGEDLPTRDPSLNEDLLLRDPSQQMFSNSALRYPSFKESTLRGEEEKDTMKDSAADSLENSVEDPMEEDEAVSSQALMDADDEPLGEGEEKDMMDDSREEDEAVPSRALVETGDDVVDEDTPARDPSQQMFSDSALRYPSFKESPLQEKEEVEAAHTSMHSPMIESILSSFDEADRDETFVGGSKPVMSESQRQQSEETDVKRNISFVDDDEEEDQWVSMFVRSKQRQEEVKHPFSFIEEKTQQLKALVARSRQQRQQSGDKEIEDKFQELKALAHVHVHEDAHFDATEDNNTISTLGSQSYFESFVGRSKPQQQQAQQLEKADGAHPPQKQQTPDLDYDKIQQLAKQAGDREQHPRNRDAGDDVNTINTVNSRVSAHSAAEKAIAAATRSELQRQREVEEFQRQRGKVVQSSTLSDTSAGDNIAGKVSSQSSSSSNAANEILEEEIARLIAARESRFEAEKAVALMKAQKELEQERRARFEAEAARLKAEEELKRLKLENTVKEDEAVAQKSTGVPQSSLLTMDDYRVETSSVASSEGGRLKSDNMAKEQAVQEKKLERVRSEKTTPSEDGARESTHVPQLSMTRAVSEATAERQARTAAGPVPAKSIDSARIEAEFARLKAEQELERLKLEKMAEEAEFARVKAEEELERLKLVKAAREAEAGKLRAEEELERLKMEKRTREEVAQHDRSHSEVSDNRLEAEATRLKAERELERIKLARSAADKEEEDVYDPEIERSNSDCEDSVIKFRKYYSSFSDDDDSEHDDGSSGEPSEPIEAFEDSSSDGDNAKTNVYETIGDDGEEELTSKRQGWFSGREEESTSRKQGWFSGEEEESTSESKGWFGFLRRGEKQLVDDGDECENARSSEVANAVLGNESDHVDELRQNVSQMDSCSESSKEVEDVANECFVVADEEDKKSPSPLHDESTSNRSLHGEENSPESFVDLADDSESIRSSSPEINEPPTISRRSFSDDEGENNIMPGGLFVEKVCVKSDEHDTASTTMVHAPVGHDFPSTTMAPALRILAESEPVSEPAVSDDEPDTQVENDNHDHSSTTMSHDLSASIRSEAASKPIEAGPVSVPANATLDNQPDLPAKKEVDEKTQRYHVTHPAVSNAASVNEAKKEKDDEAQIHHIARRTFEGDRRKGQLSFTTGSKIEAHSNQRGPWWLGRCGGRTGWFPASAVIPASEFLGSVINSPTLNVSCVVDEDETNMTQLSGDELNAVYDLIRNPSDPLDEEENDESDDESSPARNRWLGHPSKTNAASSSHEYSPPPSRVDPSEMAGLSERFYDSHDNDSRSNKSEVARERKSADPLHHPPETDETRSKDKSKEVQPQSAELSKANAANITLKSEEIRKGGKIIGSPSPSKAKANVTTNKISEWRAARDPKSGLVYYYHTGSRETTWKKPSGFVSKRYKSPAKTTPRATTTNQETHGSKDKSKGGRRIMGFLSKIKKAKPEAESPARTQISPRVTTRNVIAPTRTKHTDRSFKIESPKEINPEAKTIRQQEKEAENEPGLKLIAETELAADAESSEKDFWTTLDDDESSSSEESEDTESSEETNTSLFSKTIFKATVGKWAGKITEKLNSPPSTPYETLGDGTERLHFTTDPSAHVPPMDKSSNNTAPNDEPSSKEEVTKTRHIQPEEPTEDEVGKTQLQPEERDEEKVAEAQNQPKESSEEEMLQIQSKEPTEKEVANASSQAEETIEKEVENASSQSEESIEEQVAMAPSQSEESDEEDVGKAQLKSEESDEEEEAKTEPKSEESTEEEGAKTRETLSEDPAEGEVAKKHMPSEDAQYVGVDEDEHFNTEERFKMQMDSEYVSETNRDVLKKAEEEESNMEESKSPDRANKEAHDVNRKKTQWRSATDVATGRTYYYVKGSQKVTWVKPSDL